MKAAAGAVMALPLCLYAGLCAPLSHPATCQSLTPVPAGVVPGLRTGAEPLPGHAVAVWSDIVTEQIQLDRLAKQRKNEARMVFDW